jgi:hypothetical protein
MVEVGSDSVKQIGLGTALHHVDETAVPRVATGQDWLAVEVVDVLRDRRALGDVSAIELEHRHCSRRIPCQKLRTLVLARKDVDHDELDFVAVSNPW